MFGGWREEGVVLSFIVQISFSSLESFWGPKASQWRGVIRRSCRSYKKFSKMKVIRSGCNLNEWKGLVATILAPQTILKTEVICKSYWGLKSSSKLQNSVDQVWFFILEKNLKNNIPRNIPQNIPFGRIRCGQVGSLYWRFGWLWIFMANHGLPRGRTGSYHMALGRWKIWLEKYL